MQVNTPLGLDAPKKSPRGSVPRRFFYRKLFVNGQALGGAGHCALELEVLPAATLPDITLALEQQERGTRALSGRVRQVNRGEPIADQRDQARGS